jgi:hypothetical protein
MEAAHLEHEEFYCAEQAYFLYKHTHSIVMCWLAETTQQEPVRLSNDPTENLIVLDVVTFSGSAVQGAHPS